jgi:hypothetical protein
LIVPAFTINQETGDTIARFGLEVDVPPGVDPPYLPHRWAMLRCYTLPARGPGGHTWPAWMGALVILLATFALIGTHV